MKSIFLFVALFLSVGFTSAALAAQTGKVIIDSAPVHEFPQGESKQVDSITKDSVVAVSNLPTSGFYKVRTASGVVGWISGNDIFIAGANSNASSSYPPSDRPEIPVSKSAARKKKKSYQDSNDEMPKSSTFKDDIRIIVLGGLNNLSYGDLFTKFSSEPTNYGLQSGDLNYGMSFSFEIQKRVSPNVHVALRVEYYTASSPEKTNLSTDTNNALAGTTMKVTSSLVPIQAGLNWSPVHSEGIRLGLAGYGGFTVSGSTTVQVSTLANNVVYSSLSPCGTVALEGSFGLTRHFALAYEAGYHIEPSATTPTSKNLGAGFKLDYSGYFGRAGLELRF